MVDSNFHKKSGEYTLGELAEFSGTKLHDATKANIVVKDIAPIETASKDQITFFQNAKYASALPNIQASAIIIAEKFIAKLPSGAAALVSDNPYNTYALIAQKFYPAEYPENKISDRAVVHKTASIGKNVIIMPNAVIGAGVIIGDNSVIHANVSISHAIIGKNCIIHHGAAIGQDGFGFAFAFDKGAYTKVPQLGRVIIEDNVEIGANTTVDRGTAPDTIIGEGTKIDNLVQVAHNVKIGKHCVIAAHTGISGSTEIGSYCVIGGQVGIAGHLKIGNKVQVAAQSGIMRDVPDGAVICGSPAVPIKQFHRQTVILEKLATKKSTTEEV